jgi:hypothetical protein
MKIKSNCYGIFYRNHNRTWSGPYEGILYNKKGEAESDAEEFKKSLKKETKIMRQTWEEV